jgi:ketosteroid isomerase-like protein
MSEQSDGQRRNVEVIRAGFEAFERGDGEFVLSQMDPEIEIYSPPALANSGSFRGPEGYTRWLTDWLEAWGDFDVGTKHDEIEAVGDHHVLIPIHQTAVGRASGVPVELDLCFMAEIAGDQLVALHLYPEVEEARGIAERRESGPD